MGLVALTNDASRSATWILMAALPLHDSCVRLRWTCLNKLCILYYWIITL